ncbi:MAG: hypothetical protein JW966_04465 [Anaerolineae bacterium]|nr:hypothetical protein [Anaerolineae bacterium]
MSRSEPRFISPLDLPLMRRTVAMNLPLDQSAALAGDLHGLEDALLSAVPLADLGAPTMLLRNSGDERYIGQFRHRSGDLLAQMTFLAPEPLEGDAREWTRLLEAMAFEAGRRGAHLLCAEVEEIHPAFRAFRMAGFAVSSRQIILRRRPKPVNNAERGMLRPKLDQDSIAICTLYTNTVPRLLQQAEQPPGEESSGFVYERDGQIDGYLAVEVGRNGIVIKPYFHPEVYTQASAIILSTLSYIPQAERLPVYLYVRAYQDWLRGALEQLEFEPCLHQALMVKYTVVRVGRPETVALPGLETRRLHPPVIDGPIYLHKPTNREFRLTWPWRNGKKAKK